MTIPASRSGSDAAATAIFGASPRAGARPQVYAATAPDVSGGELIGPRMLVRGAPRAVPLTTAATDPVAAGWLWAESVAADRGGAASGHPVNGA